MSYNLNYFKNYGSEGFPYWQSSDKDNADIALHPSLVYGDYCNTGAVGKSNVEYIMSLTELVERTGLYELNEAYNTTSVAIPIKALDDAELVEILEALDDYPLLDEEHYSNVEQEMKSEAWENFGRYDFDKFLYKNNLIGEDQLDSDALDSVYYSIDNELNYPLAQEDGDSYYFNFERLIETKYLEKLKTIIKELKK